jgi:hypothetical protein
MSRGFHRSMPSARKTPAFAELRSIAANTSVTAPNVQKIAETVGETPRRNVASEAWSSSAATVAAAISSPRTIASANRIVEK